MTTRSIESDRGSASVELAILAPVVLLLFGLLAAGFRIAHADARIAGVAAAAARDASLARDPATAETSATAAADAALADRGLRCANTRVDVDTAGFAVPVDTPASVRVDVYCTVPLADVLDISGVPGSRTLHDTAVSPLDRNRSAP